MHGYGVYQFSNGHRYEGAWHEGKRRGLGMYTFRNGEIQAGYWHAGILQTPSTQNPGQGAAVAVSHSKVLHAVQVQFKITSFFCTCFVGRCHIMFMVLIWNFVFVTKMQSRFCKSK